jgi:hypothetical protein
MAHPYQNHLGSPPASNRSSATRLPNRVLSVILDIRFIFNMLQIHRWDASCTALTAMAGFHQKVVEFGQHVLLLTRLIPACTGFTCRGRPSNGKSLRFWIF